MRPNLHETADLVTFTEEILNGKLRFLCVQCLVSIAESNKTIIAESNKTMKSPLP